MEEGQVAFFPRLIQTQIVLMAAPVSACRVRVNSLCRNERPCFARPASYLQVSSLIYSNAIRVKYQDFIEIPCVLIVFPAKAGNHVDGLERFCTIHLDSCLRRKYGLGAC